MKTKSFISVLALVGGCVASMPPAPVSPAKMPAPSNFTFTAEIDSDSGSAGANEAVLPTTQSGEDGVLSVEVHAEAVSVTPPQSKYSATATFQRDVQPAKKGIPPVAININMERSGQAAGTPDEVMRRVVGQFMEIATHARSVATTRPF
jgi:hypothetical protein